MKNSWMSSGPVNSDFLFWFYGHLAKSSHVSTFLHVEQYMLRSSMVQSRYVRNKKPHKKAIKYGFFMGFFSTKAYS